MASDPLPSLSDPCCVLQVSSITTSAWATPNSSCSLWPWRPSSRHWPCARGPGSGPRCWETLGWPTVPLVTIGKPGSSITELPAYMVGARGWKQGLKGRLHSFQGTPRLGGFGGQGQPDRMDSCRSEAGPWVAKEPWAERARRVWEGGLKWGAASLWPVRALAAAPCLAAS